jgi:hypothetical protein
MFSQNSTGCEGALAHEIPVPGHVQAAPRDLLVETFPKWTLAHWCIIVTAASFLLLTLLPEGRLNEFEVSSGSEAVLVARSLAAHGTFANPFATMKTGATAHVAPVYPFLYSLILRIFGTGRTALQVAWACNVFCFALQMGLLPLLSSRLQLGILPGIVAAFLGTFSLHSPIDTRWEPFLAGLLLLLAFLATERSLLRRSPSGTLIAGVLWGISILTNPVLILLLVVWPVCWICVQPSQDRAKCVRRSVIISGLALLIVSPWIARNYTRFGTFIFVRDCLGLQLQNANTSCAAPALREHIQSGCHARSGPNANAAVAAELAAAGEVQFNRTKLHEALNWMSANRKAFLILTLKRLRLFWFPNLDGLWQTALVWTITLLSFAGVWLIIRMNPVGYVIGITWLVFPLIYYLSPFEARYRYPIFWTSLLPAAYALVRIWQALPSLHPSPRSSTAS